MKLLIVADGPRDEVTLPPLLKTILNHSVECEFEAWGRLHQRGSGRGYDRKLKFAIKQARSRGKVGLIAVVDRDKDRSDARGRDLKQARDNERATAPAYPTALGVADPHVDVWLLDDAVAVRKSLGINAATDVPNVRQSRNPKAELDKLIDTAGGDRMNALRLIAEQLDVIGCMHARETGFADFVQECRRELSGHNSAS